MNKLVHSKLIKNLEINEDKKTVVCVTDVVETSAMLFNAFVESARTRTRKNGQIFNNPNAPRKPVTMAKTHPEDEFDPYIGSALAICYNLFGSKTQFYKFVDANIEATRNKHKNKLKQQEKKEQLNKSEKNGEM